MSRAERDLGTRLDWLAIDHWNTDNPHLHILVRGKADDGRDLVIVGDYVARALRQRAEDLATLELGPRSQRQIDAARDAEIGAERWTALDRALAAAADPGRVVDLSGRPGDDADHRRLLGRAARLEALGLAEKAGPAAWRLAEDLEPRLRDLSVRGDIIKTYHRAMARGGGHPTPERLVIHPEGQAEPVIGRLVERGLADELVGTAYVLIDGLDGRQHHLRLPDLADTSDAPAGAIVELRVFDDGDGVRRRSLLVRSDPPLDQQVEAQGATWLDRRIVGRAPDDGAGGFASEVAAAQAKRAGVLVTRGLASVRDGRLAPAPGLLSTLKARDLEAAADALSKASGRPVRLAVAGDPVGGVYQERLDLASGRFAVLDDGLGFQLAPWKPAIEPRRGHAIGGVMGPGGMAWSFGRDRGPGL
jgi:hypothetical protein